MSSVDPATLEAGHILRDWNARQYLDYYYGHPAVPDDEAAMFRFLADGLRRIGTHFERGLDLGCGPVLHHAAQVVPYVDRLDMADVQDSNLAEIRRWLDAAPDAFDWSVFIGAPRGVLDTEGHPQSLAAREALMRARIQLRSCDLRSPHPLGEAIQYPLVISYYCAEWVVPSNEGWHQTMRYMTSLVQPGGWLFLAGVHATEFCVINGRRMPCARITSDDVRRVLVDNGFDDATLLVDVTPGLRPQESGIHGTFMAYAQRRA